MLSIVAAVAIPCGWFCLIVLLYCFRKDSGE